MKSRTSSSPNHKRGSVVAGILLATLAFPLINGCNSNENTASSTAPPFEEIQKIDVHSHIFEDTISLPEMLEQNNIRIVTLSNRGADGYLETMHETAIELYNKYPVRRPWGSTFDLTQRNEPGYAEDVIEWLEQSFENGAVMTKIWKEVGLEHKTPSGEFLMPDDPVFDPIYAYMADRGKPLIAHLAEPLDAWLPLDSTSVHYGYYSNNTEWHLYGKPEYPDHSEIIAARDNIMEKHPDLILIGAHLGSMEHDLDAIAERMDRYPNFYIEVSARTRDLTHHPSDEVRDFFIRHADRILYGVDITRKPWPSGSASEERQRSFVEGLEERFRRDYSYYAGNEMIEYSGREVQGLGLPRDVLEQFYSQNAIRLMPSLAN